MTHLPDSPPRKYPTRSPPRSARSSLSSSSADDDENDDTAVPVDKHEQLTHLNADAGDEQSIVASVGTCAGSGSASETTTDVTTSEADDSMPSMTVQREPTPMLLSNDSVAPVEVTDAGDDEYTLNKPQDNSSDNEMARVPSQAIDRSAANDNDSNGKDAATECEDEPIIDGPLQIDLLLVRLPSPREHQPQIDTNDSDDDSDALQAIESSSDYDNDANAHHLRDAHVDSVTRGQPPPSQDAAVFGDTEDDEYTRSLATRQRLLDDERQREQMRSDLENYVTSLATRRGDDGTQLVEFPKNYQQVLSLMSERDVRDEDATGTTGQSSNTARATTSSSSSQRSWSHVLLQAGLSKQQAFVRSPQDLHDALCLA